MPRTGGGARNAAACGGGRTYTLPAALPDELSTWNVLLVAVVAEATFSGLAGGADDDDDGMLAVPGRATSNNLSCQGGAGLHRNE